MAAVKRLVTSDEQRRRLLWIERWPQQHQSLFRPILRRTFGVDAQIKPLRRNEHAAGIVEPACLNAIEPNSKCLAKRRTCFGRGADEVRNHSTTGFDDTVTHPGHTPCMIDAILETKA
jgi:hypothetical protein